MSGTTLLNLETAVSSLGRTSISAPIVIGSMTLTGIEVPSRIRVGLKQGLVVHRLIGGDKIIQSLGTDPDSLQWTGFFTQSAALSRAQALQNIARAGAEVKFSVAGISLRAKISDFSFDLESQLAVIPYAITIEVQPTAATTSTTSASSLSSLVGTNIASAITTVSTAVTNISAYASSLISQTTAVLGQVTPIANLLGAGGLVATIQDHLTAASALASAGTNFAQAPAEAASLITSLQGAASGLTAVISQAGSNIEGISGAASSGNLTADMPSLSVARVNADILTAAVDAGAQVNAAIVNTQTAAGLTVTPAVVHA